ncbi:BTB/POZ domain-containing protein [Acorus gramineus]|uniref:BTB/POZ domain-containing protein n=1 Tax=Acorus gramineus TaxID=55184 RepID=A0AAV9AV15_ACOGR|nr:BTB/POZ domain-containing protein [Acorus gramineus]
MSSSSANHRSWWVDPDLEALDVDPDDLHPSIPLKRVPHGDLFEASRAGDVDRIRLLLDPSGGGANANARDAWDSTPLYYACLAGHVAAAQLLLESGAVCAERTFDGDRCHYAALNLRVRRLLKSFEARPPPLAPLQAALRETFLGCEANRAFLEQSGGFVAPDGSSANDGSSFNSFPPDVTFYVHGRAIEAHRAILSARSPFFKKKFETNWKDCKEVRFSKEKLSYPALYNLLHFFYCDRLEVAVDDMEDLVRICKVCKCVSLQRFLEKELIHQKYADYKSLNDIDNSQKRFILQGLALPEEDRLPAAMHRILQIALANSFRGNSETGDTLLGSNENLSCDDLADVCVRVDEKIFYCHQVILASRSEYLKARLSRMTGFLEGKYGMSIRSLPFFEEHDISPETFEKMMEYMYTDGLKDIDPDQAEEMFDIASRYLVFPFKRAVADALLPHLEMASPADLCNWLLLSDMYGVVKIREYCLDAMACNFETFADTPRFRAMLLMLPPPSGDDSSRTTRPSAPGTGVNTDQGNVLDDLREKWLQAEGAELDERDESAAMFDERLEMLLHVAEREAREVVNVHGDVA